MPLYHVNVPQYDNVLNNRRNVLKFHMLQVIEFRCDFQLVRHN